MRPSKKNNASRSSNHRMAFLQGLVEDAAVWACEDGSELQEETDGSEETFQVFRSGQRKLLTVKVNLKDNKSKTFFFSEEGKRIDGVI